MVDIVGKIAEEKIKESIRNGDFKDLSGKGKPLKIEDLSTIPEELRAGYTILKNAGILPEELQLKKEMVNLEELIACCSDEHERKRLERKLTEKRLRFNLLMDRKKMTHSRAFHSYKDKIMGKFF